MNDITVIYEDSDILVINKPSGVIVNKADTTRHELTVQDWLEQGAREACFKKPSLGVESDFYNRAGIVHRIDKETSGILIIAKNLTSFENLQAQFKERKVEKTYIALAHGKIEPLEGEISVPIGRLPWNRTRFGGMVGGRESLTKYKVISNFKSPAAQNEQLTYLELYPKTGRTHQIRVHLKHINHPIFGDELYAGRKTSRDDRKFLQRFFLHAKKISFFHPKTGKRVEFESPLSSELQNMLDALAR
jgi:23S rRNA pseudouridine1911/1915/1917 synthase